MKTFLWANLYLLPILSFTLASSWDFTFHGAVGGVAIGLLYAVVRYDIRRTPLFLISQLIGLSIVLVSFAVSQPLPTQYAVAIVFAVVALGAAITVLIGKPWTVELSAAQYSDVTEQPAFLRINLIISALWTLIYGWFSFAAWQQLGPLANWLPLLLGAGVSIILPTYLVNHELRALVKGSPQNNWTPPSFDTSSQQDSLAGTAGRPVDVSIIGAGLGGLTAAALLAESGLHVAVYEQHELAGGFCHNWVRKVRDDTQRLRLRFDAGVHDVSGAHPGGTVRAILTRLGVDDRIVWQRLDQRYVINDHCIDVPRDWRDFVRVLGKEFPADASGIATLFEIVHGVYLGMYSQNEARGGIPGTPTSVDAAMAFASDYPLAVQWMERPWIELLDLHVQSREARDVVSTLALYIAEDPATLSVGQIAPVFGYYFKGGHYPLGGSGQIAKVLVEAIEARGGKVHLRTAVTGIHASDGRVNALTIKPRRGAKQRVKTDAVVSNIDLGALLDGVLDDTTSVAILAAQIGAVTPACSATGVYLCIRGNHEMPPIVHGETAAGSVYMIAPSVIDPSAAPAGYTTIELLDIVPHAKAASWFPEEMLDDQRYRILRRTEYYRRKKTQSADDLIAAARVLIPDLDKRIVYRCDASPVTFARYTWTTAGAIYGSKCSQGMVPTKSPLTGLVLAGAATHGAGVEAVMISGAYAAEALRPGLLGNG